MYNAAKRLIDSTRLKAGKWFQLFQSFHYDDAVTKEYTLVSSRSGRTRRYAPALPRPLRSRNV
jgi:hypothetical protein